MCGICGMVNLHEHQPAPTEVLIAMRDAMVHRGPDDSGIYQDQSAGLAACRLAVIDPSPVGNMPMGSEDGRFWIVHNGEVYNYIDLRKLLLDKGYRFRTQTDTETLLYLYIEFGTKMLSLCNGMFAFAIWDSKEKTLFAARDRLGIKPFYYSIFSGRFNFASEEKSLIKAGIPAEFNQETWHELLFFRYVSGERTPYKNIFRLLPGHYLIVKNGNVEFKSWWSLTDISMVDSVQGYWDKQETICEFRALFKDSIALHRISDVPVGVLLSGGLDSSGIAAEMGAQSSSPVSTFTVRFKDNDYDEGPLAKSVAERSGLKYHELFISETDIPVLLEEATRLLDEPLVHGNDLHILAISRYSKPHVTVLLSGEGADEIFGGYVRYRLFKYERAFPILKLAAGMPLPYFQNVRLKKSLYLLRLSSANRVLFSSAEVFPSELYTISEKASFSLDYRDALVSEMGQVYPDEIRRVMAYEQSTYLQSVLDRNDRMTMGASIECRVPYLDHRLVEWAARLPIDLHFERGLGKSIIRSALRRQLPQKVIRHRKWGFGVPWSRHFREIPELRIWISRLPGQRVLESLPIQKQFVNEVVANFLGGDNSRVAILRHLAFFVLWHKVCIEGEREVLI